MASRRSFFCLLASVALLLANVPLWPAADCPMCGPVCHCAPHVKGSGCSVRSAGCGGRDGTGAIGFAGAVHAVLIAGATATPYAPIATIGNFASSLLPDPAHPPLDQPPRVSS